MTAQEFLKKTLKGWESLFEGIKLKYAYDAVTEYHIVEVKPEEIRRGSVDYKKAEMQLWMDFMEQYPDECLLICAPSDANDMTNILFETKTTWSFIISQEKVIKERVDYTQYDFYQVHSRNIAEIQLKNNSYALAA
jgi:hypothetical protein